MGHTQKRQGHPAHVRKGNEKFGSPVQTLTHRDRDFRARLELVGHLENAPATSETCCSNSAAHSTDLIQSSVREMAPLVFQQALDHAKLM